MRTIQAFALLIGGLFLLMTLALAAALAFRPAQFPAPSSEPPITWDAATDTLTITRGDVMVCMPQAAKPPACRFAKWWTETEIR